MRRSLCLAVMLVGCGRENPFFEHGGTSGQSTSGQRGSESTRGPDPTSSGAPGSSSEASSSSSSGSESDAADDGTPTEPPLLCEPGFGIQVTNGPCPGEEFFHRFCVEFAATDDPYLLTATQNPLCLSPYCETGFSGPLELKVDAHPLPELMLDATPQCGALWLSGSGYLDNDVCEVTSVLLFDETGLRLLFSNEPVLRAPLRDALPGLGGTLRTERLGDTSCGAPGDTCDGAGQYKVVVAGDRGDVDVLPDGEPEEAHHNGRVLDVYNFGSQLGHDCRPYGRWAAVWSELDYDFDP